MLKRLYCMRIQFDDEDDNDNDDDDDHDDELFFVLLVRLSDKRR